MLTVVSIDNVFPGENTVIARDAWYTIENKWNFSQNFLRQALFPFSLSSWLLQSVGVSFSYPLH